MGTDIDPCDLDLDMLMKPQDFGFVLLSDGCRP